VIAMRQLLLASCRGIVHARAKRYATGRHELTDLIGVGILAVAKALPTYEPAKSAFQSWAAYVADRAILHHVDENRTVIRVPESSRRDLTKAGKGHLVDFEQTDSDQLSSKPEPSPSALDALVVHEDRAQLQAALRKLEPIERDLIEALFGLAGKAKTLRQAATAFRMHPDDADHLRTVALAKLRVALAP
jgi:RNA polymerase sigma factor (sigma-70 family)